jgi:hypothetical protein
MYYQGDIYFNFLEKYFVVYICDSFFNSYYCTKV